MHPLHSKKNQRLMVFKKKCVDSKVVLALFTTTHIKSYIYVTYLPVQRISTSGNLTRTERANELQ
jgi:hypothetical protein